MDTTKTTSALLTEVTPWIRGMASRLARAAGGSAGADDLTQVGLAAAVRCAQTYRADGGAAFRTYCWHPVASEMRRATNASRSVLCRTGFGERDASLDRSRGDESEESWGDSLPDAAPSAEERVERAELEAKVRAIVCRVRAEWKNKAMFDDLIERLQSSTFNSAERSRSEVSLTEIAEKHGMSRQGAHVNEKSLRARLEEALAALDEE